MFVPPVAVAFLTVVPPSATATNGRRGGERVEEMEEVKRDIRQTVKDKKQSQRRQGDKMLERQRQREGKGRTKKR